MEGKEEGDSYLDLKFTDNIVVPIKHLASELDLPIHERDTFTGFEVRPRPT